MYHISSQTSAVFYGQIIPAALYRPGPERFPGYGRVRAARFGYPVWPELEHLPERNKLPRRKRTGYSEEH
jgi:hypothetical protein